MKDWFTVERLDCETFAISEYRHWEQTHCYLLLGTRSALLIDTGLGIANLRKVVDSLTKLPVLAVTTHVHWDHIGGHGLFGKIAVHEKEESWLSGGFPLPLEVVKRNLTRLPCDFPAEFDLASYRIFQGKPEQILGDGDWIDLGGRRVQAVHTPGHSPGHCCFYEPERGYLYTGDLIYQGCLDAFYPTTNPELFFQSVQKIRRLAFGRVLPGHFNLDVPIDLTRRVEAAFAGLRQAGKLKQGGGLFDFGYFQIHI